jgi:uncharacterized protein (TIGR03437 family)
MDTTVKAVGKAALFIGTMVLLAANGRAQLLVNGSTNPFPAGSPLTLYSEGTADVSVSGSGGATVAYTVSKTGTWFVVYDGTGFTPASSETTGTTVGQELILTTASASGFSSCAPNCVGTVTLTPTSGASNMIVINVAYSSGVGSSGGSGTLFTSPSSGITLSALSGVAQQTFLVENSTTSSVTFSLAVTYPAGAATGWLSETDTTTFSVTSSQPATVTITANTAGLPAGSYLGYVVITPTTTTQTPITFPITFIVGSTTTTGTLTASPSSVSLSYPGGPISQAVTLTSSTGAATFSATTTSNGNWLLVDGNTYVSGIPVTSGLTLSVGNAVSSLTTGTYGGYATVTASDGSTAQINVTLTMNNGTVSGITITPIPLTAFTATAGSTAAQQATLYVSGGTSVTAAVSSTGLCGASWLQVAPTSSTATPTDLTVTVNPSGLAAGTCLGSITLNTNPNGVPSSQVVAVTLVVGSASSIGSTSFLVAPGSLSFASQVSQTAAVPAQYLIVGGGATLTSVTAAYTTTANGINWLSASAVGTNTIGVTVVPEALPAGVYTGQVTVSSTAGTQSVPVTLTVDTTAVLLSTCQCVMSYLTGTASPSAVAYLSSSDGSTFQIASATSTVSWLSVTATATSLGIAANPSGLATGLYTGGVTVTISSTNTSSGTYANLPLTIPVALLVNGGTSSGPLTFSPTVLSLAPQPGSQPINTTLTVSASTPTPFAVTSTPASGTSWLTIVPTSYETPTTVTVQVNPAGLVAGQTYTGELTFTANGSVQTVNVVAAVPSGVLGATPSSLSFTGVAGGSVTSAQPVMVTATSATAFTVSTSVPWLQVSPTSGTTPATINVTGNPVGLMAGTFMGTVTLTPTSGAATTVSVSFLVTAPTAIPSSTSLTFTSSGGSVPAAQTVTISGSFTATATSSGNWLSVSPASGAAGSTISVSVNPAGLGVGSNTGTISIAGTNGGTSTINVTLTVTAPLPTITKAVNAASYVGGAISPGEVLYISGTNLGPATLAGPQINTSTGKLATTLSGVQVLIDGFPAPLVYVQATQVAAIAPYEIAPFANATVEVQYLGQTSNVLSLQVTTTAPGIFTQNAQGTGPGAFNADFSLNGPNNPVAPGGYVVVYLTGEGQTTPLGVTGTINSSTSLANIPKPLLPVTVTLGGQTLPASAIEYVGGVPGEVEGVTQLNIRIPTNAASGSLPLIVTIGGNSSQPGVTVSVQ